MKRARMVESEVLGFGFAIGSNNHGHALAVWFVAPLVWLLECKSKCFHVVIG